MPLAGHKACRGIGRKENGRIHGIRPFVFVGNFKPSSLLKGLINDKAQ
jgi:hypothetical protein